MKKTKKKDKYYIVEIRFNKEMMKFDVVNRWRVIFSTTKQCVYKKCRRKLEIIDINNSYYGSGAMQFKVFLEKKAFIQNNISKGFLMNITRFILIKQNEYKPLKTELDKICNFTETEKAIKDFKGRIYLVESAINSYNNYKASFERYQDLLKEAEKYFNVRYREFEIKRGKILKLLENIENKEDKAKLEDLLARHLQIPEGLKIPEN